MLVDRPTEIHTYVSGCHATFLLCRFLELGQNETL